MSYRDMPCVTDIDPRNNSNEVPTSKKLYFKFNVDLDVNSLGSNIHIHDSLGVSVGFSYIYDNRLLTINAPENGWDPGTSYVVTIIGDTVLDVNNPLGIRSVLGATMAGNFTLNFRTVASVTLTGATLIYPGNETVITTDEPVLKWGALENAANYEIMISQFSTLAPVIWHGTQITTTEVCPDVEMPEGEYYWRVRGVDATGRNGDWSAIGHFRIDLTNYNPVTEEDKLPVEFPSGSVEPLLVGPEDLEAFPKADAVNVSPKLRTVYVSLPEGVVPDKIVLVGVKVGGAPYYLDVNYSLKSDKFVFKKALPIDTDIEIVLRYYSIDGCVIIQIPKINSPLSQSEIILNEIAPEGLQVDLNQNPFRVVGVNPLDDSIHEVTGDVTVEYLPNGEVLMGYTLDTLS